MERFKIIAFTHKSTELNHLSRFFIDEEIREEKLKAIKQLADIDEMIYVATCNRIEFLFANNEQMDELFLHKFFKAINHDWTEEEIEWNVAHCVHFTGKKALQHILRVASSLDSLVVGEREIIGQVRKAYDVCQKQGLAGDLLRLVMNATVKTAKEIFTDTKIAERSVSVVFLAYQMLQNQMVPLDARFLIIGAGQTNGTMAKYLLKHGFKNFTVFNRTLANAKKLAEELKGDAYSLTELANYKKGFDVIISCTGSADTIVTKEIYASLLGEDKGKKIMIDMAIPFDIDAEITNIHNAKLIGIEDIKAIANENLKFRQKELVLAESIVSANIDEFEHNLKHRKVELAMKDVPKKIREIKHTAINAVFAKEIEQMDEASREILEKVMTYMEKKCISVPMLLAKDILINS